MNEDEETASNLGRVCWTITTLACLIGAVIVFVKGDRGYGVVCLVVALSAAVNLL